jgi:predicted xylose isomerase-like sugar epimerase
MKHPLVNRTSPKGTSFVGTCAACGKRGLTLVTMNEECPNQRRMTREQAIVEAIKGQTGTA